MEWNEEIMQCNIATAFNDQHVCWGHICIDCEIYKKNGGYCNGCIHYNKKCSKRICAFTTCFKCGGGKHAVVPGICGRAPELWRKKIYKIFDYKFKAYAPKAIHVKSRIIPVIYPQIRKYRIPEHFPQIDAWVTPLHKVCNRKGDFRSNDLKDFVGLESKHKLILMTCAPDDYQEMLWEKADSIDYRKLNIDYWFPGHFSIYDDDSKLYQFFNAKRQQLHAVKSQSQFVWFRLGENIPLSFLEPIRKAKSILISTNQMIWKKNKMILKNEVSLADSFFPLDAVFYIVGGLRNLPLINSKRIYYKIDSNWLIRGLKGTNMQRVSIPKNKMTIKKLLIKNLEDVLSVFNENHI
jgi:hypothetical protein